MIGWKVLCEIDDKEVVAEIVANPIPIVGGNWTRFFVYHNEKIRNVDIYNEVALKVIERK